jgi:NAD-dependent deacetylase
MQREKIVVLTGAGISAESGLKTFRDSGGLWEGYDINEVASIEGWYRDPVKVLQFYNLRRSQAATAQPNAAHFALRELEAYFEVVIVTQNVDDLHERAGSSKIIHLHGQLTQARSERNPALVIEIGENPILPGDEAPDGTQLRPNIVWFGEPVPMIEIAAKEVSEADILLVIGTSLAVYPAAGLIHYAGVGTNKIIIDPGYPGLYDNRGWEHVKSTACEGVPEIVERLKK